MHMCICAYASPLAQRSRKTPPATGHGMQACCHCRAITYFMYKVARSTCSVTSKHACTAFARLGRPPRPPTHAQTLHAFARMPGNAGQAVHASCQTGSVCMACIFARPRRSCAIRVTAAAQHACTHTASSSSNAAIPTHLVHPVRVQDAQARGLAAHALLRDVAQVARGLELRNALAGGLSVHDTLQHGASRSTGDGSVRVVVPVAARRAPPPVTRGNNAAGDSTNALRGRRASGVWVRAAVPAGTHALPPLPVPLLLCAAGSRTLCTGRLRFPRRTRTR